MNPITKSQKTTSASETSKGRIETLNQTKFHDTGIYARHLPAISNIKSIDKAQNERESSLNPKFHKLNDSNLNSVEDIVKIEIVHEFNNETESVYNDYNKSLRDTEFIEVKSEITIDFNEEGQTSSKIDVINDDHHGIKSENVEDEEHEVTDNYAMTYNEADEKLEIEIENSYNEELINVKEENISYELHESDYDKEAQEKIGLVRKTNSLTLLRDRRNITLPGCKELVVVVEDIGLSKYITEDSYKRLDAKVQFSKDNKNTSLINKNIIIKDESNRSENLITSDPCNTSQYVDNFNYKSIKIIDTKSLKDQFICDTCHKKFHHKTALIQHILKHPKMYSCTYCSYKTCHRGNLSYHVNAKHTKLISYSCSYCSYKTYRKMDFSRHVNSKHTKNTYFQCPDCSHVAYRKENLRRHMKIHTKITTVIDNSFNDNENLKNILVCDTCDTSFEHKSNLIQHLLKHSELYSCTYCSYTTNKIGQLSRHVDDKHSKKNYFKCSICNLVSYGKENLNQHIKKHAKDTICGSKILNEIEVLKEIFICDTCDNPFQHKAALIQHILNHPKVHNCTYCSYKTIRKDNLSRHVDAKHNKRNFECCICSHLSSTKENFDRHMQNHTESTVYIGNSPNDTEVLQKVKKESVTNNSDAFDEKFQNKATLMQHTLENRKLHNCTYCSYKTIRKDNLSRHIETKHTKPIVFHCSYCSYKTNRKEHIGRHVDAKHTETTLYNCSHCSYKTNRIDHFNRHVDSIHNKSNFLNCSFCSYKTIRKEHLNRHMNTKHFKVASFNCSSCNYKAYDKGSLNKHIKVKH